MNDTILFSALQDMQRGLFNHKQAAVKENRFVYSFTLLAKVVCRARRLLADLMKRQPAQPRLAGSSERQCPDELRCS